MCKFHLTAKIVAIGSRITVVTAVNISTMIDAVDHAAPLAARRPSYEYIFWHHDPISIVRVL